MYIEIQILLSHEGFAGGMEVAGHWFLDSAHVSSPGSLFEISPATYQTNPHCSFSTSFMLLSL